MRILTAYGVTEATIDSTYSPLDGVGQAPDGQALDGPVPVGGPLPGVRVYVLDRYMGPVAVGVAGEVFIGGVGVARGYGGRPALTAERFVADPFAGDGSRLYRTGDRGRWRPGGQLEFLGRADEQVKVRGFRIEPGEVEALLESHPAVSAAVVGVWGVQEHTRLTAWLVPTDPAAGIPTVSELRGHLAERLPEFMVPSVFTEVAALPLSPNGKVDRSALPAPDVSRPDVGVFTAPATATQELLAGIWALVLEVERVGADDNFFELGGHSLLATQVISRVREVFGTEVPVAALFDHPTVAGLADVVEGPSAEVPVPPVEPAGRDQRLPLSFAQQRLWFLDQMEPGSVEYNVPVPVGLGGEVDVAALGAALGALTRRHEVLRTRLVAGHDGVPYQVIDPPSPFPLPVVDVSGAADPRRAAEALVMADAAEPFDLATGPVIRGCLARVGTDRHLLVLSVHHAAFDEWSALILRRELRALHTAIGAGEPDPLPPLPVQYADYALWQRIWLSGRVLETQLAYWRDQLAALPTLDLPTDRPRPAIRTTTGAAVRFTVPAPTVEQLRQLARDHGATMFMTTMAAFAVLLGRYTSQHDIPIGTPIANRNRAETENLIGYFVNTLVIRTDLTDDPTFAELLERLRTTALAAYAHQDLPFEQLVDELVTQRDRSRTPLFQTLFNYDTTTGTGGGADTAANGSRPQAGEGAVARQDTDDVDGDVVAQTDVRLVLVERGGGLAGAVEYSTGLFDRDSIARLVGHFGALLEGIADGGGLRRLSELPVVSAAEREELLRWAVGVEAGVGSGTGAEVAVDGMDGVVGLVLGHAEVRADAVAVVVGDVSMTYGRLAESAARLAGYLRGLGVGRGSVVGLCVSREVEMVVGVLGVWLAGAAYVPLDPGYPADRLGYMLADSGAAVVVGAESLVAEMPVGRGVRVVELDDPVTAAAIAGSPVSRDGAAGAGLAYVMYTSGSTGRPKGVLVDHGGVANLVAGQGPVFGITPGVVVAGFASFSFDAAVSEVWVTLGRGGRLVIVDEDERVDTARLAQVLAAAGVGVVTLPPSVARVVDPAQFAGLATLVLAGERADGHLVARWADRCVVVNAYGPTEASVCATAGPVDPAAIAAAGGVVPIGTPLPGLRVHVLDEQLSPMPLGVAGELFIGGLGLAWGYAGRAALTAERFVADPLAGDGSRLYRSGDRARWRPGGVLEFLGRIDEQVKVRGFRIEPGEVEAVLTAHPHVSAAAVAVTEGQDPQLAAWLVPGDPDTGIPTAAELREFAGRRLPEFMIPAHFTEITQLPLTRNGKLDRAALPAPDTARPDLGGFTAPATPAQELLAGIWEQVLGVERVGATDNFFELGGHSLLATQVISRVREVFGTEVPVSALFDHPTVAGLAEVVEGTASGVPVPGVVPVGRDGRLPLSFAQQRLWFLDVLEPGSVEYNAPMPLRLPAVDVAALGAALSAVVRRHEVLRTRLVAGEDGVPFQVIDPPSPFRLPVVDVSAAADPREAAGLLVGADAVEPFDLAAGPLIRACLVRLSGDEHVLILTVHHVVFDEWSAGIFHRELAALYEAFRRGEPDPLSPLPVQYADFAVWQRQWLTSAVLEGQLAFWRERLAGVPVLELPVDRPRPVVRSSVGA
ncbi:amino acid adenylation domain-containing protein, partial [Actinomadura nitritigenes]|uniref:amino acid adenylation domain-containing protein n=1 Tax=Actinomadura nitritigenes TaxID=134602 RepID=UPI003695D61F